MQVVGVGESGKAVGEVVGLVGSCKWEGRFGAGCGLGEETRCKLAMKGRGEGLIRQVEKRMDLVSWLREKGHGPFSAYKGERVQVEACSCAHGFMQNGILG